MQKTESRLQVLSIAVRYEPVGDTPCQLQPFRVIER